MVTEKQTMLIKPWWNPPALSSPATPSHVIPKEELALSILNPAHTRQLPDPGSVLKMLRISKAQTI